MSFRILAVPRALSTVVLLLGIALADPARAADPNEHLNELEPQRPGFLPDHPDGLFQLPPLPPDEAIPSAPSSDAVGVHVERIQFKGNTVVATEALDALAAPYVGRTLSALDMENLRRRITQFYIDAGYINSGAVLGPEAFSGGTLTYTLIEGRLTAIRLTGLEGLNPHYITSRLDETDGPLNLDTLRDRFQLLLADPLINQMNAKLLPGDSPGEANLDVDVTRAAPYQLTTYFNNYRPPSIGAEAFGFRGSARNLTNQGDLLELSEETPIQGGGVVSTGVHWHMPLLQPNTQLVVLYDHGDSAVTEEPVNILGIRSILVSKGLGIEQTLFDSLQQHFSVGLYRVVRENRTTLLGEPFSFIPGEPDGDTEAPVWRFVQDYTDRTLTDVVALRSTFSFVKDNEQTQLGLPTEAEPDRDYTVWLGQAQYARQVLDNGAQIILRGTVQETNAHVLPLDSMTIGGDATVRGFRENQLLTDKGQIVNVEFSYPLVHDQHTGLDLAMIPFYDIGHGTTVGQGSATLSSVGLAGQLHWRGLQLDLSKAYRLVYPEAIVSGRGNLQDRGIYFQLQYTVLSR